MLIWDFFKRLILLTIVNNLKGHVIHTKIRMKLSPLKIYLSCVHIESYLSTKISKEISLHFVADAINSQTYHMNRGKNKKVDCVK